MRVFERSGIDAFLPLKRAPTGSGTVSVEVKVPHGLQEIHAHFPGPIFSEKWRNAVNVQEELGGAGVFKSDQQLILFGQ